jgi:hypothetical protein
MLWANVRVKMRDIAVQVEKITNWATARYMFLARSFFIILGGFAIWWGIAGFPVFWRDASIEKVATRIIAGDPYKVETLALLRPVLDTVEKAPYCRPAALRSAAIIQLRMLEVASPKTDRQHLDQSQKSLIGVIRSSLSCLPADPFLWLALYSLEVAKNGLKPEYLNYLRLSYKTGPQEGWIVLKRNPLAFKAFQRLPADIGKDVIDELFAMLHDSRFSDQAAETLIGPAWPERGLILSRLARLTDSDHQHFADALHRRGYDLVPGIGLAPVDPHRFAPKIRVPQ